MSVTWLQCFEQMTPAIVDNTKVVRSNVAATLIPVHEFAYAQGSAAPSMGSFLGLNGTINFKKSMKMERRDCIVAAAMNSGYHQLAIKNVSGRV